MHSRRLCAAGAVVVLTGLAGCADGGGGRSGATPTTTPPAVTGLGARAGDPGPTDPQATAASATASRGVRTVSQLTFQTPSTNIVCDLNTESVRCDVVRRTWTPPPAPADCELDYGQGAYLQRGQEAQLSCVGDTLVGSATTTLAYGDTVQAGPLACTSDAAGLTCRDTGTAHGFTLAAKSYRIF